MLKLILPEVLQQNFFLAAARHATRPVIIERLADQLLLHDLPAAQTAQTLGESVFPYYERLRLQQFCHRHFRCFELSERRQIVALAEAIAAGDVPRGGLFSGPHRLTRISEAILTLLEAPVFDFTGFCRFRLKGHEQYLRYLLNLAADEFLAIEEEREYHELLASIARPEGKCRALHLFCCEGDICQIWESGDRGPRHVEGGCFTGREDMLISNLIAARPDQLVIHGAAHLPLKTAAVLDVAFGSRLAYAAENPAESAGRPLTNDNCGDMIQTIP